MTLSRLKLVSSHGDQTLSGVRFAIHGTANPAATADLLQAGLRLVEGSPVVGTNLTQIFTAAEPPDRVFVMGVPPQFYLGYGVFTTAYVDRALRRVVGAPLKYAAARSQLAFYRDHQVEQARERIEAEVAEGYALQQRPTFVVEPRNLVGHFSLTPVLRSLVSRLQVAGGSFQAIDLAELEIALSELFRPTDPAASILVSAVISNLIIGTVESAAMTRLRLLRWEGLRLVGYEFFEGQERIELPPSSPSLSAYTQLLAKLQLDLEASQLFTGQLTWLKQYVATELQIMRVELDESTRI